MFIPLLNEFFFRGMFSSVSLYFQKFEFNASVYYLIREIGFWLTGYNIIGIAGIGLAVCTFIIILALAMMENVGQCNLPGIFIWPLFIYLALATTVHPWYITPIIAFSVFSKFRFAVLWSFLILWSYEGYSATGFAENMLFVCVEYLFLLGMVIYELKRNGLPFRPDHKWSEMLYGE
jgi:hypothetical protein